jgi:hypothetical protein
MDSPTNIATKSKKLPSLKQALLSAVAQQVIFIGITGVIMDGGVTQLKCLYAFVAYWVGFTILMIRRRTRFVKTDHCRPKYRMNVL